MKKFLLILTGIWFISANLYGQEYMTRSGYIWFYSQTPVEDIKANNRQVACILNAETGKYKVPVSGKLTIHGVTNKISTDVTLTVKEDNVITAKTMFIAKPADYDIDIPKVVRNKIAKEIEVHVDFQLKKR